MVSFTRYDYSFNKNLLLLIGLWPTPDKRFRIFRIFIYVVYLPYMFLQATWFLTADRNLRWLTNILTLFLVNVICFMKYVFYHLRGTTVYNLFKEIEFDLKYLKNDKQSIEILRNCVAFVHVLTVVLMMVCCVNTSISVALCLLMPKSQAPENHMSFWQFPFSMNEFDTSICKSGLLILLTSTTIDAVIVISTDTTILTFSEHACALFKVGRFMQYFWDEFTVIFLMTLLFGSIATIGSLISLHHSFESKDDARLAATAAVVVISVFIYILLVTHFGQRVTDHSLDVFYDAYNSNWYEIPLEAQKFYLIIMQRSIRSFEYVIPGLFVSSKEGLASFLHTTFAAVTIFYSMQT